MPTTYLPTVREHGIVVVQSTERPGWFNVYDWHGDDASRTFEDHRSILCTRPESIVEDWERTLTRNDRRAKWDFERIDGEVTWICVAKATPASIGRTDRFDLLLIHIFGLSCLAAARKDWDRVAYLDDRIVRLEQQFQDALVARYAD